MAVHSTTTQAAGLGTDMPMPVNPPQLQPQPSAPRSREVGSSPHETQVVATDSYQKAIASEFTRPLREEGTGLTIPPPPRLLSTAAQSSLFTEILEKYTSFITTISSVPTLLQPTERNTSTPIPPRHKPSS